MADAAEAQNKQIVNQKTNANTPDSIARLPNAIEMNVAQLPALPDTSAINGQLVMPNPMDKREQKIKALQGISNKPLRDAVISALDIKKSYERPMVLSSLASNASIEDAKIIASVMDNAASRSIEQANIADRMRRAGEDPSEMFATAEKSALEEKDPEMRDISNYYLTGRLIDAGNYEDAERNANLIEDNNFHAGALERLTSNFVRRNDLDGATRIANSDKNPLIRAEVQTHTAATMDSCGLDPSEMLKAAETSALIAKEPGRSEARSGIVSGLLKQNQLKQAEELACMITKLDIRSQRLTDVAVKIAETGEDPTKMLAYAEASALAAKDNSQALNYLGNGLMQLGKYDQAGAVLEKITDPRVRANAQARLAEQLKE